MTGGARFDQQGASKWHDGQITRLPVKPLKSKTIRFTGILIYGINPASRPTEGRFAIVTIRWAQDAMAAAISGVTA
jgi:hypothetical protein